MIIIKLVKAHQKQKFLDYHLSYVPLINLNTSKEIETDNKLFNNDSIEKTNSQTQIPFSSRFSTKDNTKCNTFRNKINNKNYLNISNSNFVTDLKSYQSLIGNKENIKNRGSNKIFSYDNYKMNSLEKNENEKYKGNIKEKIKDFYKELKSKGCLSFLNNPENNMFFMRKFNKKYISAIKRNKSYKINNSKTIDSTQSKNLPEIKEINNNLYNK